MYFARLLIKVGSFWLASQLELARYTTELKPKLGSFENSNESSQAEPLYIWPLGVPNYDFFYNQKHKPTKRKNGLSDKHPNYDFFYN
jgi:hypothetical protein